MEWMESSEGGMSNECHRGGKREGEGKQETQESLWEDEERLVM